MVDIVNERPVKQVRAWEEYVSQGMEAREQKDNSEWLLGDLANQITTDYGEDSIGKYAYGIGVVKKTLMNYRSTAKKFPQEMRKRYTKLSFSHFRAVQGLTAPEAWLIQADDNDWSVEMLAEEVKKAYDTEIPTDVEDKPPKVFRCPQCGHWRLENISTFEICKGHYEVINGKIEYK